MWVSEEQDLLVRRPAGVQGVLSLKPNKATGAPFSELYSNIKTPFMFMSYLLKPIHLNNLVVRC